MAVVIDEMEVVTAERDANRGGDAPPARADQAENPADHEVERMLQRHVERCERVWAH